MATPTKRKKKVSKPTTTSSLPFGEERVCSCCQTMLLAPSGSIFTVEDGTIVVLEPPAVASYLRIDPAGSGLPHWNPE